MEEKILRDIAKFIFRSEPRPGRCFRCERVINEDVEFRDTRSQKEWHISHLCQQCQDRMFRDRDDTPTKF
jgi:hypothetical protein